MIVDYRSHQENLASCNDRRPRAGAIWQDEKVNYVNIFSKANGRSEERRVGKEC